MYIADLHIHSKYSRATAADCDAPHLHLWARRKGIGLLGTGDFTHPKWRSELSLQLEPAEDGFYRLKKEFILPDCTLGAQEPRFVLSGEISTIYSSGGKTRKVHHVILLPSLEAAQELSLRLEKVGNIHSDGRPILGISSRDLLQLTMDSCPDAIFIPAHIWTPHFSLFGAFSQFETVEECYGDMAQYIHAMETGLSSDPPMNRRVSLLDRYTLVSNSDAHSPQKLGREANILDTAMNYASLKNALESGEGFLGTIEFFPEEGKYHLDGHRNCGVCLMPEDTRQLDGRCPVCGRKLTVGVMNRVEQLADRVEAPALPKPFESLIPLPELIASTMGVGAQSKRCTAVYEQLLQKLGTEFDILRRITPEEMEKCAGFGLGEALRRLRSGQVYRQGGYDGEYGKITVFQPHELELLEGQTSLFALAGMPPPKPKKQMAVQKTEVSSKPDEAQLQSINPEQQAAICTNAAITAVSAGPGTGKTYTLVERIAYMVETLGIPPGEITAVTFTRQAAKEMQQRLCKRLNKKTAAKLMVGTFHSVCLSFAEPKPILPRETALSIMEELISLRGEKTSPRAELEALSRWKNGVMPGVRPSGLWLDYMDRLSEENLQDLDDILLSALQADTKKKKAFHHLLVDEFQDINPLQHQLVEKWLAQSLFVIGDSDQSIYGFRGADASAFDKLSERHPETLRITLRQNYRSAPEVLSAAMAIISHNPGGKRSWESKRPAGSPVRLITAATPYDEAEWIAEEISGMTGGVDMLSAHGGKARNSNFRAFSDVAVLCRTRRQLDRIRQCLQKEGIPCTVTGRSEDAQSKTVAGMMGFFSWLFTFQNTAALQAALEGIWNCPKPLVQRAMAAAAETENGDIASFADKLAPFELLAGFCDAARQLMTRLDKDKPHILFASLAQSANLPEEETASLLGAAAFYPTMKEFLDAFLTGEEEELIRQVSGNVESGAVRLMTLHASKGLEFPVVFLAGLNKGDLPLERETAPADEEEERRLFFVGVTRAKEELILTCGGVPSPFLAQLPEDVRPHEAGKAKKQRVKQLSFF